MTYYSFNDIIRSHNLSKESLKQMVKKGKIKAERICWSRESTNSFKYVIPETELPKLAEFRFSEPVASVDAQPDYYETIWREQDERRQLAREKHKCEVMYYNYLHSEKWREKRRLALKRDGYRCQMCGTGINLNVHHISYANLGTDAEMDDIVTLCEKCHEKVHVKDLEKKPSMISLFDYEM